WLQARSPSFNVVEFLTKLGEADEITDESGLVAVIGSCGVELSEDDVSSLKTEVAGADSELLLKLVSVVRRAVKLVGIETVTSQLVNVFDMDAAALEEEAPAVAETDVKDAVAEGIFSIF
ncbi:hypothetical protein HK405_005551, partial [Cladochytrium tenue]